MVLRRSRPPHPSLSPRRGERVEKGRRGAAEPYPKLGEGGFGRTETTLDEALAEAAAALAKAGFEEPRRQARRLVSAALNLSAAFVLAHPERPLEPAERERVRAVLERMLAHEPLSRIQGRREFWGLDFALSPQTLDPRPESETLVEAVLRRLPDRGAPLFVLDVGTGTGCLLLALLSELPASRGVGVDIAEGAAATARANARALGLADRASFLVGHWGEALKGPFDVVVANPPYIATPAISGLPREVRDYDPRRALDGGPDGLGAYRALAPDAARLLEPEGLFACEIGIGQGGAVGAIFAEAGLAVAGVEPDLAGIPRVLLARRGPCDDKKMVGKRVRRD
jgi:release factor glutamine methyltransferase